MTRALKGRSFGLHARCLGQLGRASRSLPPSSWKNRLGRLVAYCFYDPPAVAAEVEGVRYMLRPAARLCGGMFWSGTYEEDLTSLLTNLVARGWVVADVGANVGLIGLRVANRLRKLGGGRVLFFEPVPANTALLRCSIVMNELQTYTEVFQLGLWDSQVTAYIHPEGRAHMSGDAMLASPTGVKMSRGDLKWLRRRTTIPVNLQSLDLIFPETGHAGLDLIKLDVEGSEVACLRGALQVIERYRPIVVGEFSSLQMPLFNTTFTDAAALLRPLGYRIFAFRGPRHLIEVQPRPGMGDVVLVPDNRMSHFVHTVRAMPAGRVELATA